MEGKAAEYRSQIDTRAAQEEALTEEVMRAANPELYAKQQKEAEQRKSAAAAADAAMTKKTAPPTTEPAQKEAAAITVDAIRNMTQEQINKINTSRAFSKLTKEQRNALITRHFQLRGG